ncbi:ABC transporter permease [Halosimplex litoreum]|uniref:ABC transporter permease n=1 Tax=Halosimplex litoreum TaxID=1198301 RepID=A0A7T3FZC5_9EURY|nr:ABC transporter permease [Halosimplex litoreum]QPV63367.1 ABC transporter permease [Halosimplex litoreum]
MSPTKDSPARDDRDEDPAFAAIEGDDDAIDPESVTGAGDSGPSRPAISGHARKGRVAADDGEPGDGLRTDGAGGSVSEFEQMADVSLSETERRRQWFEEKILAPARIVWDDWRARFGVVVVTFYLLMGTVGLQLVAEPSPNQGPLLVGAFRTLQYPLGTTASGTDIMSQIVYSTPTMLIMITSGAVFTVVLGTVTGTLAGYKGGRTDSVLMTISDVMMTIPGLPLTIVLATALSINGNPVVIGVLITVNAWAGLARAIRSQVLTLRDAEYVEASRIMGIGTPKIIASDIIPNLMPYISMNFVRQARAVIFGAVGLYFLGVLPYNSNNWGVMMNAAVNRAGATSSPAAFHWLLVPMVTIIVLALGLTLLAQGADRVFNPRVRARHAKTVEDDGDEEGDGGGPGGATSAATGGI